MSVCLSAHITREPQDRYSPNLLFMFPVILVQSSSDDVVIHYAPSFLRMMLCFLTVEPIGQNQAERYIFDEVWQVAAPHQQLVFG